MKTITSLLVALFVCMLGACANLNTSSISVQKWQSVRSLKLANLPSGDVEVTWSAVAGYDIYAVYRDGLYVETVENSTKYVDGAVMSDTDYRYSVLALPKGMEAPESLF